MNQMVKISVYEVVGSTLCVASDDGQKVHDRVATALDNGRLATISFLNVTGLTSAFLNAAIGQLYGSHSEEEIRALLSVQDMEDDDLALLKRVVETAKLYFSDPQHFRQVAREVMVEESDEG